MKQSRQRETQNAAHTTPHQRQEVGEIRDHQRHQADGQHHRPSQQDAVRAVAEPPLHHLVDGVHHERESEEEVYTETDLNGDRRVILREYLAFTEKRGFIRRSNQEWFRKLDKDKKGSLGFNDVMTLCYIVKSGRPFCKGCREFMSGVFFTCVKCFDSSPSCFSVCFQCYESGNIEHEHKAFLDNFALLEVKRRKSVFPELRATAGQVQILRKDSHPQGHDPMKEVRQIAMAYCRTTSEDIKEKEKIRKLFSSMHYGNHERVALHEFLELMRQKSYKQLIYNNLDLEFMNTPEFFRKLDKEKKGSLDFSELLRARRRHLLFVSSLLQWPKIYTQRCPPSVFG